MRLPTIAPSAVNTRRRLGGRLGRVSEVVGRKCRVGGPPSRRSRFGATAFTWPAEPKLTLASGRRERRLAEGEGFEPPERFPVQRFSRPPVSTTHTSLRTWMAGPLHPANRPVPRGHFVVPIVSVVLIVRPPLHPAPTLFSPSPRNRAGPWAGRRSRPLAARFRGSRSMSGRPRGPIR
jgi:hypothetical protein